MPLPLVLHGSDEKLNIPFQDLLYMMSHFSLISFKILFIFDNWLYCVLVGLFVCILLEVPWAFWMCRFMSFINFGRFSAFIFSNIFSVFYFPSGTPNMQMLVCLTVSHRSLRLCLSFFILFSFSNCIISVYLSSSLLILFSICSHLMLNPLLKFLFQFLYFSTSGFLFVDILFGGTSFFWFPLISPPWFLYSFNLI